ncbi:hypothetical protein NE237_013110 [Protea cynaroides]|uniref:Uncharacterized protein n=1 Tax=Protea cynaroides TaxID=273540 RepID=A0A9Q0JYM6_9MAGN|nr:hypothetical protein NE237_013110 [Protea cynaroides]
MDILSQNSRFFLLLFYFLHLSFSCRLSFAFFPIDNYLIDCGSNADTTVDIDNRHFLGDSSKPGSVLLPVTRSISLKDQNPSLGSSPLYQTARVFTKPSNYEFNIKQNGTHLALNISIGPSSLSSSSRVNVILNGVEIMKMNNSMGSLDGKLSVGSVLQSSLRGETNVFVLSVIGVSLLLAAVGVMYRKRTEVGEYMAWSPLPVDASESS